MVAERYGISEQTVWKWRKRDSVHDLSHVQHRPPPMRAASCVTWRVQRR
jgi:transposase-like protein